MSSQQPRTEPPVYLVVGAGEGISAATATLFAARGWQTVLVARSETTVERAAELVATAAPESPSPIRLIADASHPAALRDAIESLDLGRVDVAHFNVGLFLPGGLDTDLGAVSSALDTGAVAALAMAQAVVPVMRRAPGTPRTLLFTGGGTADFPMRASLALGLEKAALRNLALGLDAELREEGIHVATLTVYGIVAPETPFAPTAIADAMAELIDESESASEHWTTVGEFRGR